MNIKPGSLCVVVGGVKTPGLLNRFVIVEARTHSGEIFGPNLWVADDGGEFVWMCVSAVSGDLLPTITGGCLRHLPRRPICASILKPINGDNPGNESWFTAAPRSKPATTKGDTITERELQS